MSTKKFVYSFDRLHGPQKPTKHTHTHIDTLTVYTRCTHTPMGLSTVNFFNKATQNDTQLAVDTGLRASYNSCLKLIA